jgi:hypothetical protein
MKTLYLHIGYPKTGTTGIQRFLADNKFLLEKRGVLVPATGMLNGAHYLFNFSLGIGTYEGGKEVPKSEDLQAELRQEIEQSDCDKVVISSEYFVTARSIRAVKDFFQDYDTKIIVYLRRHDLAFESSFAQAEKTTLDPPWDFNISSFALYSMCTNGTPYNYLGTLRNWAEIFGRAAIIVRPFEKQQFVPDLFGDLLAVLDVADGPDFIRPGILNSSLGYETLYALRLARKLNLPATAVGRVHGRILAMPSEKSSERYFSPALRTALVNHYMPTYRQIAQEFLGRADGKLFMDPAPKPSDPWTAPPEPDFAKAAERVLKALGTLIK